MKEYDNVFFCTLTFRDELIADKEGGFLIPSEEKKDSIRCFKLFTRRLRRRDFKISGQKFNFNKAIKYFSVLEKGDLNHRFHWHMLLFTNYGFNVDIMRQCILDTWQYGICDVRIANPGSISYLTKYMFKEDYKMLISHGLGFGLDNIEQYIRGSVRFGGYTYGIPSSISSKIRRTYRDFYDNYYLPRKQMSNFQYQLTQKNETKEEAVKRYERYLIDKKSKENKY